MMSFYGIQHVYDVLLVLYMCVGCFWIYYYFFLMWHFWHLMRHMAKDCHLVTFGIYEIIFSRNKMAILKKKKHFFNKNITKCFRFVRKHLGGKHLRSCNFQGENTYLRWFFGCWEACFYRVLTVQFLQQRVVRGFGEVTLLVHQGQEAQFLWKPGKKNQHPPLPFRDMLRGVVSNTKSTHLLDQVQTLAVVHPVDVSPHQTFPAGGQGSGRSSQFVNNLLQ